MLFQGEEWAASSPFQYFADHDDKEMARLVSEGRKREFAAFGWSPESIPDPEKPETFQRSKLNWNELNVGEHAEMLAWYRALIELRPTTVSMKDGEPQQARVHYNERDMWFCMERGNITLNCNLSNMERRFPLDEGDYVVLSSHRIALARHGAVTLPPNSVALINRSSLRIKQDSKD